MHQGFADELMITCSIICYDLLVNYHNQALYNMEIPQMNQESDLAEDYYTDTRALLVI